MISICFTCGYWQNEYNWRKQETVINRFFHFTTTVDGINLHFIRVGKHGLPPFPLIISHGWSRSIVEFLDIIEEPLVHPERFGDGNDDALMSLLHIYCSGLESRGSFGRVIDNSTGFFIFQQYDLLFYLIFRVYQPSYHWIFGQQSFFPFLIIKL